MSLPSMKPHQRNIFIIFNRKIFILYQENISLLDNKMSVTYHIPLSLLLLTNAEFTHSLTHLFYVDYYKCQVQFRNCWVLGTGNAAVKMTGKEHCLATSILVNLGSRKMKQTNEGIPERNNFSKEDVRKKMKYIHMIERIWHFRLELSPNSGQLSKLWTRVSKQSELQVKKPQESQQLNH